MQSMSKVNAALLFGGKSPLLVTMQRKATTAKAHLVTRPRSHTL